MNLCEALAKSEWVRSPDAHMGKWIRFQEDGYFDENGNSWRFTARYLGFTNWEPKPAPRKPRELMVIMYHNRAATAYLVGSEDRAISNLKAEGFELTRFREVMEGEG